MAFNRFRVYDIMQRSVSTILFGTTVAGSVFIGVNVYFNYVEKKRLQEELIQRQIAQDKIERDSSNSSSS